MLIEEIEKDVYWRNTSYRCRDYQYDADEILKFNVFCNVKSSVCYCLSSEYAKISH